MKHYRKIQLLFLLLPFVGFTQNIESVNGEINLTNYDFSKIGKIKLNGIWQLYESAFILTDSQANYTLSSIDAEVPLAWNDLNNSKDLKDGLGYGTYRLLIHKNKGDHFVIMLKDIGSSYKLWVNKVFVKEIGKIGKDEENSLPSYQTYNYELPTDTNLIDLVLEVSNFHQHQGGLKSHLTLIRKNQANLQHERETLIRYFSFGTIFIIGFYHIGLFLMNRKDTASVNFGLFCFDIFIFLLFRSRSIYYFYSDFDWELGNKIEYISLFFSLPLFYIFFYRSFPPNFKKIFELLSLWISLIFISIVLFTSTPIFSVLLPYFHAFLLLYIGIVLVGLFGALRDKQLGSQLILAGFFVFMIALINDILHVQNIIDTNNYITLGVLGFIICQAMFLAYRSALDKKNISELSVNLITLNSSLERFVPADFMHLLNRKSITEINLGNYVEKEMTIMFSDIRSFTTISEKLSAAKSFDFINDYLQVMGPIIREHNGFIDKYIGDGIMALFPNDPNDAIICAQKMIAALEKFNEGNANIGTPIIEIGIGLHTGSCVLGAVGESKRLDTTVISDSVNLAARIESLTKHYKTPIIISADTFNRIAKNNQVQIRFIGTAMVKGKSIQTKLYKVFSNVKDNGILLDEFDKAISYYYLKEFAKAKEVFTQLSKTELNDGVLQLYLNRCTQFEKEGPPVDWQTFEVFEY